MGELRTFTGTYTQNGEGLVTTGTPAEGAPEMVFFSRRTAAVTGP